MESGEMPARLRTEALENVNVGGMPPLAAISRVASESG